MAFLSLRCMEVKLMDAYKKKQRFQIDRSKIRRPNLPETFYIYCTEVRLIVIERGFYEVLITRHGFKKCE